MENLKSLTELKNKIQQLVPFLTAQYQMESLALFGSYVRDDQNADSDLDILVTFQETPSLFKFLQLEHYLTDELGVKIDLVMKDGLKPRIGERILSEAVPI